MCYSRRLTFCRFALVFALLWQQTKGQNVGGLDLSNPFTLLSNFGVLTFDNFFSDVANLFWGKRRLVCGIKMINLLLSDPLNNFLSGSYKEDSVMILPEAGVYRGPENILEYVSFANQFSPFINAWTILSSEATVVGYNGQGQCEFDYRLFSQYDMEESIVERPVQFTAPVLTKMFVDYEENYLSKVYVFYTKPFLEFFFGTLATESMAEFVCDTVLSSTNCTSQLGEPPADCVARMLELPLATEDLYVDGDSFGCRILHAAFARTNPRHCAHVSLNPSDVDANGQAICSRSYQFDRADFFSEGDVERLVEFGQRNGVDPRVGYINV